MVNRYFYLHFLFQKLYFHSVSNANRSSNYVFQLYSYFESCSGKDMKNAFLPSPFLNIVKCLPYFRTLHSHVFYS